MITDDELKKELNIHPATTIHKYNLWIPIDIYLKLYRIQEENGLGAHMINDQIVEILKKYFEDE